MIVLKFRSSSDADDLLRKAEKMYKFSKELVDHLESCIKDDDEDYRYSERREDMSERESYRGRYRRM